MSPCHHVTHSCQRRLHRFRSGRNRLGGGALTGEGAFKFAPHGGDDLAQLGMGLEALDFGRNVGLRLGVDRVILVEFHVAAHHGKAVLFSPCTQDRAAGDILDKLPARIFLRAGFSQHKEAKVAKGGLLVRSRRLEEDVIFKGQPGLFEIADGGTLFIDEFGELAGSLQAKLLRVLEDGVIRRIGSVKERRVRARILAATNRNLAEEVRAGRFREDLYYRVNILTIQLPPLRERQGDVPLLTQSFLGTHWKLEPGVLEILEGYSWPGNVRQLLNAVERAKILADDEYIRMANLPPEILNTDQIPVVARAGTHVDLETLNRMHVIEVLKQYQGNKARTARALGIGRRSLYRLLEKYGLHTTDVGATEGQEGVMTSQDSDD